MLNIAAISGPAPKTSKAALPYAHRVGREVILWSKGSTTAIIERVTGKHAYLSNGERYEHGKIERQYGSGILYID